MVTPEEARAEITKTEQAITRAREELARARIPPPTRAELIGKTRLQRMQEETKLRKQREAKIRELERVEVEYRKEVAPVKEQIATYEAQRKAFETQRVAYERETQEWAFVERMRDVGKLWIAMKSPTASIRTKARQLMRGEKATKVEPLIAWKEPTGKIRYQSIDPKVAEKMGLIPVAVHPKTLRELPEYKAEFEEIPVEPKIDIFEALKIPEVEDKMKGFLTTPIAPFLLGKFQKAMEITERRIGFEYEPKFEWQRKIQERLKKPAPQWAIGLTDILIKSLMFAPYMATGVAQKRQLTQRQQLEIYKRTITEKEAGERAMSVVSKIESAYAKGGKSAVQKEVLNVLKQLKTPEARQAFSNVLKDLHSKGLISDYAFNIETGALGFGKELPSTIWLQKVPTMPRIGEVTVAAQIPTYITKPPFVVEKPRQYQILGVPQILKPKIKEKVKEKVEVKAVLKLKTKLQIKQAQKSFQKQLQVQKQIQKQKQVQIQKQLQVQKQIQKQQLKQKLGLKPKFVPKFLWVGMLKPKRKEILVSALAKVERAGYNAFAKQKGKWHKLNVVPISKQEALDLGSHITDVSLSARFKIKPTEKSAKKSKLNIPKNYFGFSRHKFRDYMERKGKRIALINEFIEHRKYRLDTRKETQTIQQARRRLRKKKRKGGVMKWL